MGLEPKGVFGQGERVAYARLKGGRFQNVRNAAGQDERVVRPDQRTVLIKYRLDRGCACLVKAAMDDDPSATLGLGHLPLVCCRVGGRSPTTDLVFF